MKKTEGKFSVGDEVVAIAHPSLPLVVRRFVDNIYYCIDKAMPEANQHVYFERELSRI